MKFQPGGRMTLFVVVMLPVLVSLGTWQMRRGYEKEALIAVALARGTELPRTFQGGDLAPHEFSRVSLTGRYDTSREVLLDAKMHRGRVGYWVVTPFVLGAAQSGIAVPVNRGWIAAPRLREDLPDTALSAAIDNAARGEQSATGRNGDHAQQGVSGAGFVTISGLVWPLLGDNPFADTSWPVGWPKRVMQLDLVRWDTEVNGGAVPRAVDVAGADISGQRGDSAASTEVAPAGMREVRLFEGEPGGLEPVATGFPGMSAERHWGYAVQWFLLALVLLTGYVVLGRRRGLEDE